MSDRFSPIPINRLFQIISSEYSERKEIFGIPEELFFVPKPDDKFRMQRYGKTLETPIGVAAGPHTQMAQNIIVAWLCGARYMELKTVQTLDELNVSKPCIDMQDEGYNCEWSQELKIYESFDEYLKAWILIHLLKHKFGWASNKDIGVIFNMSVGYNMEGILKENVQWFFEKMKNCCVEKNICISILKEFYPSITEIEIPDCISDNITLSTMHGCPPEEIENIGLYLINEKKLNTTIKLNPTLLGAEKLRNILNTKLGFKTEVPDLAFEHDLKFPDAIKLINSLQKAADKNKVHFGLKLTNTLESVNNKDVFPEAEKMMYMSGRALHPVCIHVAQKLQHEFIGRLDISFCAGADCFNIVDILKCGFKPVTVCSDILRPGGYGRLLQYIENIRESGIAEFSNDIKYLDQYTLDVLKNDSYKRDPYFSPSIKTNRSLEFFDCIHAPCVDTCPTNQDIPEYLYYTSEGDFQKAFDVIMMKNPFPNVLGMVCDHLCQTKCSRINYDDALQIREIKRFVVEKELKHDVTLNAPVGKKVAIIGAGPSGLSCAYFLKLAGFEVDVFETKAVPGGMVSEAIPAFRLKYESIQKDIQRIEKLGVNIFYESKIDKKIFAELQKSHDFIYIAAGAQRFKNLGMESEEANGVLNAFDFLNAVKKGNTFELGKNIIIIGGGNTAMDVARSAYRLSDKDAKVKVLYRRSRNEMPADVEEVKELFEEGIELQELVTPEKIITKKGKITHLICCRMKLVKEQNDTRPKPVKIKKSEFEIAVDTLIPALGQETEIDFISEEFLKTNTESFETKIKNVFIGGDAMRGAATIVKAVGDGRKAAAQIAKKAGVNISFDPTSPEKSMQHKDYILRKSKCIKTKHPETISGDERKNFNIITSALNQKQAVEEASRCFYCNDVCSVCVTVCPNRANYYYQSTPSVTPVWKVVFAGDSFSFEKTTEIKINQKYQILNIADFCNECGNCTTFCPSNGAPYKDKPKFYLSSKSFNETDHGFMLSKLKDNTVLISKNNGSITTLTKAKDVYEYETERIKIIFLKDDFIPKEAIAFDHSKKEVDLEEAASLKILMEAAGNLY